MKHDAQFQSPTTPNTKNLHKKELLLIGRVNKVGISKMEEKKAKEKKINGIISPLKSFRARKQFMEKIKIPLKVLEKIT